MKKLFVAIAMSAIFLASNVWAWEQPKLPVELGQFRLLCEGDGNCETVLSCGKVEMYVYDKNPDATWYAMYLNHAQFPNPLYLGRVARNSREDWIDRNRDGIFDENFTDYDALHQQYPDLCDAVK